jgi:proline iminopeptidase
MVHGGPGMSSDYFVPALPSITKRLSVASYDQGQIGDHSINGLMKELHWVVDDLIQQSKNVTIFGHSFGAALALEFYKNFPSKVRKLILCSWICDNSFTDFRNRHFRQKDLLDSVIQKTKQISSDVEPNEYYRDLCLAWLPLYFPEQSLERGKRALSEIRYNAILRDSIWSEFVSSLNLKPVVEGIIIPTLSIVGSDDGITLPEYVKQAALLNPKFITHTEIPNSGHFPFIDKSDMFAELVSNFVFSN